MRRGQFRTINVTDVFQFTHPGKGATKVVSVAAIDHTFQFTHPGKGATEEERPKEDERNVSIHAPWEGCDALASALRACEPCFNSRTLGRVRQEGGASGYTSFKFQFTHPGKGATCRGSLFRKSTDVSIHAPWEGCDSISRLFPPIPRVSIHAPWEGCDIKDFDQSRTLDVSIHAPWEGCDAAALADF